jgi:Uma2 family endonuclease
MRSMSSPTSHANPELPAIDERLVAPESGYEIDDGKLVRVPPADEPHAARHSIIQALLEAHAADEFMVACDMLMRLSQTSDRAPDASVYPRARDPVTGRRQIDQLAFEIVNTESLADAAKKARDMVNRGVRRVFAIDVERTRALEWSRELGTWSSLDLASSIEDPALAVPLPLDALVRSARADDAVARALLAKRNPVLVAAVEAAGEAGRRETLADAVVCVLAQRKIAVEPAERDRIIGERELARLQRWLAAAATCTTVGELFDAG